MKTLEEIKDLMVGKSVITNLADLLRTNDEEFAESDEDVLTYALFPQLAVPFFKRRQAAKYGVDKTIFDKDSQVHPV